MTLPGVRRPRRFRRGLFSLAAVLLFSQCDLSTAAEPFRDGDRWTVIGDSITHNGFYHAAIHAYYLTRFPDRSLEPANAGIAGDTAAGAVRRYGWDIRPKRATVATVMLGMNDVGRSLYGPEAPADHEGRKAAALARHRENMAELVRLLQADGVRIVLLTPSIYDETAGLASPALAGVNDALGECAAFLRELAAENGAEVIDLHGPMTALNRRLQENDPAFTLIGPDRVHPRAPGHLVMAYYFLKAQGVPAEVSHVALDADSLKVVMAANAEVGGLKQEAGGLAFIVRSKSLPYPVGDDAKPALAWIPFTEELNRELLAVSGLAEGAYMLSIDGEPVRTCSAAELAAGVNLALEDTPQARQAARVLALVKKRRALEASGLRGVVQVEHAVFKNMAQPMTFEEARPTVEKKLEAVRAGNDARKVYYAGIYERYLQMTPRTEETVRQLARLGEEIRSAAQPVSHTYRLTPLEK